MKMKWLIGLMMLASVQALAASVASGGLVGFYLQSSILNPHGFFAYPRLF